MQIPAEHCRVLLDIARSAIRHMLRGDVLPPLPTNDRLLSQPAGCFVSLHELHTHRLRGCVGRLDASDPLAQAVQQTAAGVLEDPRFAGERVTLQHLPLLELEISVIAPLRPAGNPLDFDRAEDGLYLTCGGVTGCFLPQVARETGWTKEQLLDRLCTEKLGLPPSAWRTPSAKLFLFSTQIIGPEAFEEQSIRR